MRRRSSFLQKQHHPRASKGGLLRKAHALRANPAMPCTQQRSLHYQKDVEEAFICCRKRKKIAVEAAATAGEFSCHARRDTINQATNCPAFVVPYKLPTTFLNRPKELTGPAVGPSGPTYPYAPPQNRTVCCVHTSLISGSCYCWRTRVDPICQIMAN